MKRILVSIIAGFLAFAPIARATPPWDLTAQTPQLGPWNYLSIGCGLENWYGDGTSLAGVSITVGASTSIFWVGHNQQVGNPVYISATAGSVFPTGLVEYQTYYVRTVINANSIELSATQGGAALATSGSISGWFTVTSDCAQVLYTPSYSTTDWIYAVKGTGGGAGGCVNKGGGGAGSTVFEFLSGIPANTRLVLINGSAGRTCKNGTNSTVIYGGSGLTPSSPTRLFEATAGKASTTTQGGQGGDISALCGPAYSIENATGPCIRKSSWGVNGGSGGPLTYEPITNKRSSIGGASFWGGGFSNVTLPAAAEGAGGSYDEIAGAAFEGYKGRISIQAVYGW